VGLIEVLDGKNVFLDTAPFIYVFENKLPYKDLLAPVFLAVDAGTIHADSSLITVVEVLSMPYRLGQWDLVETYRKVFGHLSNVSVFPLTLETADLTAQIRGRYNLKTPDAIQWATATLQNVDYFLTNDKGFKVLNDDRVLIVDEYLQL
jgi:predicted nucleic acid-binding protein